jgi:alanine or glycine:cation symporter, AGCS family
MEKVIFFDFGTSQWLEVSIPFVVLWLFCGAVYLTLRMGFINFRGFYHAIRLTQGVYDKASDKGDVSHFQALAAALSATVGLGNIAGVAIAIGTGGPGASFWIMVVGLLGMTSKFAECTSGQLYRSTDENGHVLGGPMRYLQVGLAEIGLPVLGRCLR